MNSHTPANAKTYHFVSHWTFEAPPQQVWKALVDPLMWPQWWPSLDTAAPKGSRARTGSETKAVFRAPLGYRLHLILAITSQDYLRLITFKSGGDLLGNGRMQMRVHGGRTHLAIYWDVATTKPWMNRFAFILSQPFRSSHAYVMRSGEQGLEAYLAKRP